MTALIGLHAALTPAPVPATPAGIFFAKAINGWQKLRGQPPDQLDDWSRRHLDALAALEARAPQAVEGETLVHFDIRADNMLLTPDQVYIVDWPHACLGAAWVDVVAFAPSVAMQGGPPPEELLAHHPAARSADPNDISAAVASIAGYFTRQALKPPPPGIPTVRAFQAAQGIETRRWLAQRMGWDIPHMP
jgi:aminoglycoside phosphotransferase (APT) family kinase protein